MIEPSKLPEDIYTSLRHRGHEIKEIANMTPDEAFDEYCNWKGLCGWGNTLRNAYQSINKSKIRVRVIEESNPEISAPPSAGPLDRGCSGAGDKP